MTARERHVVGQQRHARRGRAESGKQFGLVQQAAHGAPQGVHVAGFHEQSVHLVVHQLGDAAGSRGDDRDAARDALPLLYRLAAEELDR